MKFTFDNNGLVKSVTYLGSEKVQVSSLAGLIGLSETYLNQLAERHSSGLIENVSEFLSENWAMALYHQWFSEFRYTLKQKLVDAPELGGLMDVAADKAISKDGYLSRDLVKERLASVPESLRQVIRVKSVELGRRPAVHP